MNFHANIGIYLFNYTHNVNRWDHLMIDKQTVNHLSCRLIKTDSFIYNTIGQWLMLDLLFVKH